MLNRFGTTTVVRPPKVGIVHDVRSMVPTYSINFTNAYKIPKARAKTMKPEKSWVKPVAYFGPQISLTDDKKTTRHTFVMIAMGMADKNSKNRFHMAAFSQ